MKRTLIASTAIAVLAATALGAVAFAQGPGPGGRPCDGGPGAMRGPQQMSMLLQADTDHDGALSAAEMAAHHQARFAAMDRDGDGTVSRQEFIDRQPVMGGPGRQGMAGDPARDAWRAERRADQRGAMFDRLDSDGDGALSAAEWQAMAPRLLTRLDRDGDGALSREELSQAGMPHRGWHGPGRRMPPPAPGVAPEAVPETVPEADSGPGTN